MSKAIVTENSQLLVAHRREVARATINAAKGTDKLWYLVNGLYVRHDVDNTEKVYSIIDGVDIFTDTKGDPRQFWNDKKQALIGSNTELSENIRRFKLIAPDGKRRLTDVASLWGLLAIINELRTPASYDLINAIFKGVAGGVDNAMLRYRAMNIESGSEWGANDVHERMRFLDKPTDEGLQWWQK